MSSEKKSVKELMQHYINTNKMGTYSKFITWIRTEGTEKQQKECIEFRNALVEKKTFKLTEKNTRPYKHK